MTITTFDTSILTPSDTADIYAVACTLDRILHLPGRREFQARILNIRNGIYDSNIIQDAPEFLGESPIETLMDVTDKIESRS